MLVSFQNPSTGKSVHFAEPQISKRVHMNHCSVTQVGYQREGFTFLWHSAQSSTQLLGDLGSWADFVNQQARWPGMSHLRLLDLSSVLWMAELATVLCHILSNTHILWDLYDVPWGLCGNPTTYSSIPHYHSPITQLNSKEWALQFRHTLALSSSVKNRRNLTSSVPRLMTPQGLSARVLQVLCRLVFCAGNGFSMTMSLLLFLARINKLLMIFNKKQMLPMRMGPGCLLILVEFFLPWWMEADGVGDPHDILQDQSRPQTVELRTIALYNSKGMEQWYDV